MRELVMTTIADQPDIDVVGETGDEATITEWVDKTRPDVLVVTLDDPAIQPNICGFLLGRYPQMKVIAVATEQNATVMFWGFIDIRSTRVENSEMGIMSAIRGCAETAIAKR